MADTLFFAAMLFYGWSVGSGLDRSGNLPSGSPFPGAAHVGAHICGPQVYGKRVLAVRAAVRACPDPTAALHRAEIKCEVIP